MPVTLFAAICSPLPDPPSTTPNDRVGGDGLGGAQHEDRVVVEGVVAVWPVVGDLVPARLEEGDEVDEQVVCRVVAAEVDRMLGLRVEDRARGCACA